MLRTAKALGIQLLPAIFLVLLGWGFDALPEFFFNPARAALAALTVAAVGVAVCLKLDLQPTRRGPAPVSNQSLQLGILFFLSSAVLWFLPFADRRHILTLHENSWRYFGLVLCAIGVIIRLLALKALGTFFSAYVTLQSNHRLVREGVYKQIRHPLYLSLLLIPTGIALIFASVLALPILALAIIFIFDRIGKEESLLAERFGPSFEDYRRNTWKLIPHLL